MIYFNASAKAPQFGETQVEKKQKNSTSCPTHGIWNDRADMLQSKQKFSGSDYHPAPNFYHKRTSA